MNPRAVLFLKTLAVVVSLALFGCDTNSSVESNAGKNVGEDVPLVLTVRYDGNTQVVFTSTARPASSSVISPSGNFGLPSLQPSLRWVAFKDFETLEVTELITKNDYSGSLGMSNFDL